MRWVGLTALAAAAVPGTGPASAATFFENYNILPQDVVNFWSGYHSGIYIKEFPIVPVVISPGDAVNFTLTLSSPIYLPGPGLERLGGGVIAVLDQGLAHVEAGIPQPIFAGKNLISAFTYGVSIEYGPIGDPLKSDFTLDHTSLVVTYPAPEPATWTLLLVGFGALGEALRSARRRLLQGVSAAVG